MATTRWRTTPWQRAATARLLLDKGGHESVQIAPTVRARASFIRKAEESRRLTGAMGFMPSGMRMRSMEHGMWRRKLISCGA